MREPLIFLWFMLDWRKPVADDAGHGQNASRET